ncbi:MAG: anti-sigma factor [Phycisphaerales bacterium]|nr:anti-sigma factor [Phycisphaerales bacterium]
MSDQLALLERVNELLAAHAVGDLSAAELAELQNALSTLKGQGFAVGTIRDVETLAASIAVGEDGTPTEVPAGLKRALVAQGVALVRGMSTERGAVVGERAEEGGESREERRDERGGGEATRARLRFVSGWVAAAAAVVIAAVGWLRTPVGAEAAAPSWVQRQKLIDEHKDTAVFSFASTDDPVGKTLAGGDVVWNQRLQKGFLRFKGLAVNNPSAEQYQLWIFDPARPSEYPVDGGVFDARQAFTDASTGDMVIPIDPKLLVRGNPAAFAVTVEQAGGVVVTDRKRVFALAPTAKPAGENEKPKDEGK